ncbi:MAG: LacI family DNA-binding transcriptional regulator [Puniceicoccaceae bacterium]
MSKLEPKKKATITDVAKAAGVATGTVSRVFNRHADVNEEIRQRVLAAANELGYVRLRQRKSTRSGVSQKQGNIGIICFGMEDTLIQIPIISRALQGVEHSLSNEGRNLMIANIPRGDRIPPFLVEGKVEGLILKGPNQGKLPPVQNYELLKYIYRLPHIWLMGKLSGAEGDHCNFDTWEASHLAVDYFAEKGHKHVAFFNPKPGQTQFERLKSTFLVACQEKGVDSSLLEVEPPTELQWPLPAITQTENVFHLVEDWLAIPKEQRPTGLFVPSDRTSIQLYTALERKGLRAGRDVSIISCNNEKSMTANLHPALASIDVHAELIGHRAVDQLLWRIAHPNVETDMEILIKPSLIRGESVTNP